MSRFILSDHHLRHQKMYRFVTADGSRVRDWAQTCDEADEMMIEAHNRIVHPKDTVYFLGDVAIARKGLDLLKRMNGRKILLRGNHDIFKLKDYLPYFDDVRGTHKIDQVILSHYPIHPHSIPRWCHANVHGHIHKAHVMKRSWGRQVRDTRYINMCVEIAGLEPVSVETVLDQARAAYEARSASLWRKFTS